MPTPFVKKLSIETGRSIEDIEGLWEKAKEITAEKFDMKVEDFGSEQYAYTVGIVKRMVQAEEELTDPERFLSSSKNAHEYLEDMMTSSSFDIGNVTVSPGVVTPVDEPVTVTRDDENGGSPEESGDVGDRYDLEVKDSVEAEDENEGESVDTHDWTEDDYFDQKTGETDPLRALPDVLVGKTDEST